VKYLLALLLLLTLTSQAEPLYPFLNQANADSLRRKLWQSSPSIDRVNLLVRLGFDLTAKGLYSNKPTDSAKFYIRQAQALSKSLHYDAGQIESDYAWANLIAQDRMAARQLILQALARSQKQHDNYREALGWYFLANTYDNSPAALLEQIHCYEQAIHRSQLAHHLTLEAGSLKQLADVHLKQGKPALAREELLRVAALYRAAGYPSLHYTFELLAAANSALGNYRDALQYALAATQSAKSCKDTVLLFSFYMRVGSMYQELNQREKTVAYYQLAERSAEQYHDTTLVLEITRGIAKNLITLNRAQQALAFTLQKHHSFPAFDNFSRILEAETRTLCYLATKQYDLANKWCKQLEVLAASDAMANHYRLQQRVYLVIGNYYLASRQYAKAQHYLLKSLVGSQHEGSRDGMATACLLLYKVDSAQSNLPSAIAYYKRYKAINDSIFNEKNSKQIAGLQIQYDTERREQSIALLTKRNLVQQLTIRQREFQRNAILGGAGLLVLVLGLGYNRYRLKQRSSLLLEQKQHALEAQQAEIHRKNEALEQVLGEKDQLLEERQELLVEKDWMLKEIHHRVKNNLQVVSSLLATQSRHLHDPQAVAAIRESQNRVQVMALLHQKLYQADNIGRVNMADYGREIVTYLVESFDRQRSVHTKLDLALVELETTLATPLGLIINEAVTNALKHAFPPPQRGTLTVSLACLAPQQYQLTISDNGVGLPAGFDLTRSRSLGMVIIKGLSRQLDGQLAMSTAQGVQLSLQFNTSKKPVYAEAGA
jgi:two-component sensor histidine kinase